MRSSSWKSQLGVRRQTDGFEDSKRNAGRVTKKAAEVEVVGPKRLKVDPLLSACGVCHGDDVAA
ncbi:MAG: hypothetical protein ACLP9L_24530 [Thermoguttaceae bacterium]